MLGLEGLGGLERRLLEDAFEKWQGSNEQIDDVCAIGVRITM